MIPNSEPAVTISKKAKIALDVLQPVDQKRVLKAISLLNEPVGELLSRGQVKKLAVPGKFFVIRATPKVRIIFSIVDEQVEVMDIVLADRLHRIFEPAAE